VADASILVGDRVLNGSKGALFYSSDECSAKPSAWNAMPLTLYHPFDPITNEHLSASHPGVLDRQGLGFTWGDHWVIENGVGKRRVKAWFDEQVLDNKSPDLKRRLLSGDPIELSTGLFTENEPARLGSCASNGKAYDFIARDHQPDHLAILPDQVGACSVRDGCGVNNAGVVANCTAAEPCET